MQSRQESGVFFIEKKKNGIKNEKEKMKYVLSKSESGKILRI